MKWGQLRKVISNTYLKIYIHDSINNYVDYSSINDDKYDDEDVIDMFFISNGIVDSLKLKLAMEDY